MNMIVKTGLAAMLVSLAACGSAETNEGASPAANKGESPAATSQSADTHTGTGTVDSVSGNEVTISHDPIETLDWPAMTMAFTVEDAALLNGIQAGDRVSFAFSKTGSTSTLTSISKQ